MKVPQTASLVACTNTKPTPVGPRIALSRRCCGILLSASQAQRAYGPRVRFARLATRGIACSSEIAANRLLHSTPKCKYQGANSITGVTE
jgi:hypothetical protein